MQVKPNYIKSLLTSHDSAQTAFKDPQLQRPSDASRRALIG